MSYMRKLAVDKDKQYYLATKIAFNAGIEDILEMSP